MARRRRRKPKQAGSEKPAPQQQKQQAPKAKDSKPAAQQPQKGAKRRRSSSRRSPRKPIGVRLANLLDSFPPSPEKLNEYLKTCRDLRNALRKGDFTEISEEEVFYLFASGIETQAEEELDRLFDSKYRERLEKIRQENGLGESEFWKPDDSRIPEEYSQTLDEFREEKRAVLGRLFAKQGEQETADLIENDYAAYQNLRDEGKDKIFARSPYDTLKLPDVRTEIPEKEPETDEVPASESME